MNLLLGTDSGLYCYNTNTMDFDKSKNYTDKNKIVDLCVDDNGLIYCSVEDNGDTYFHFGNSYIYKSKLCKYCSSFCVSYKGKIYFTSNNQNQIYSIHYNESSVLMENVFCSKETMETGGAYPFVSINDIIKRNTRIYATMINDVSKKDGCVVELINFRVIYTGLKDPRNIFFNKEDRLCFCGGEDKIFYFGDKSKRLPSYVSCAIESVYEKCYYVFCSGNCLEIYKLQYNGKVLQQVFLEDFKGRCYNVIEIIEEK